jgi:hypothetical protein
MNSVSRVTEPSYVNTSELLIDPSIVMVSPEKHDPEFSPGEHTGWSLGAVISTFGSIMPLPSAQAIPAETAARATKTPKRNTPVNFIRILP